MAEVFRTVGGRKLTEIIAKDRVVQQRVTVETRQRAERASAALAAAKTHNPIVGRRSQVTVERGRTDRFIILDDSRDLFAALAIEFGRKGYTTEDGRTVGPAEGLWILHDAVGLPRRSV